MREKQTYLDAIWPPEKKKKKSIGLMTKLL